MIKQTITEATFHDNGKLAYTETRGYIKRGTEAEHDSQRLRVNSEGIYWCRVGLNGKYREDGTTEWEIVNDANGKLLKSVLNT